MSGEKPKSAEYMGEVPGAFSADSRKLLDEISNWIEHNFPEPEGFFMVLIPTKYKTYWVTGNRNREVTVWDSLALLEMGKMAVMLDAEKKARSQR